ncbi:hypothetical protein ACFSKW_39460 [Nonomuraea mangrovi]|uniref:Uncharacterized protein n=1 Tax=Nonomuraea mangrovi TaxID=2316207 RepID=A0ABW4T6F4_9ACTN
MPQVCVGPEFSVDPNGRLRLDLCGSPAEQAWPYPCPTSRNPLRVDPSCGLWVPPYPKAGRASASGTTGGALVTVPAGYTEVAQAEIEVENPSDCYAAIVVQWVQVDVDLYLPAGADSRAGFRINGNAVMANENAAPASGTQETGIHWELTQTLVSGTIPAGGSNTFTAPIDVGSGQGGAQYGEIRWQMRVLVLAGL